MEWNQNASFMRRIYCIFIDNFTTLLNILRSLLSQDANHMNFTLLRLLNEAKGSLLDDETLLNTLQTSKVTSQEVSEQLQVSEQTEIKIDAAREVRDKVVVAKLSVC